MSAGDWKDLFRAVQENNLPMVKYHVDAAVDLDYQHPEILTTPLVEAIKQGHDEIAIYLINSGASLTVRSELEGLLPLEAAKKWQRQGLKLLILENGGGKKGSSLSRWLDRLLPF
ncbi:ankyrin repeat domain-containing protein [Pseudobacteriovorax antillogorgiicola]|uniref:Ankyrin repeat-containing protein n=1 Tax=Pseudobacteriovorax antillogorgiicola TaxID=1513793 RepID=A0A1Y6BSN7_9BACT|nr:ankyrin repeat domain-containing protein [Pseudobacteriovorax antillogorgiicola]TCS53055.1 ankyrin repeat protein [Pseudobacteriovorax antillogorgiicola]SMF26385.1 Ankyrin repeat-containing protein [Pseudobacteriovorax antillogorgiicola]